MDWIQNVISHLPSQADLVSAIPVIVSLIIIEGLLSVDNAMAIAAMASNLPKHQQKLALRFGIIGAYGFRGLCMAFAAYISGNLWIKALGAAYLLYLMSDHLLTDEEDENADGVLDGKQRGFVATIFAIEVMDLSLSVDNVVAAVAMDKRLWVVCTGVFIGILALRFVAGFCIKLIEKYPVLKKTAFMLVGFVGAILLTELGLEWVNIHYEITAFEKFIGIMLITFSSIAYSHTEAGRKLLTPVVIVGVPAVKVLSKFFEIILSPFVMVYDFARRGFRAMFGSPTPTK